MKKFLIALFSVLFALFLVAAVRVPSQSWFRLAGNNVAVGSVVTATNLDGSGHWAAPNSEFNPLFVGIPGSEGRWLITNDVTDRLHIFNLGYPLQQFVLEPTGQPGGNGRISATNMNLELANGSITIDGGITSAGASIFNSTVTFNDSVLMTQDIQIPAGAGAGKVFTSDATGGGTWQPALGAGDFQTLSSFAEFAPSPNQGVIASSMPYQSWPNLFAAPDTNLLYHIFGGGNIHLNTNGCLLMCVSTNAGATWSANSVVVTNANSDPRNFAAGTDKNGRLYIIYGNRNVSANALTNSVVVASDDHGVTWNPLATITPPMVAPGGTNTATAWGDVFEQDGYLFSGMYVFTNSTLTAGYAYCLRSADRGTNWTAFLIAGNTTSGLGEPKLSGWGRGVLYSATRIQATGSDGRVSFSTSTDNGATWTFNGNGLNQLASTSSNPVDMVLDADGNICIATADRITGKILLFSLPAAMSANSANWNAAVPWVIGTNMPALSGGYCSLLHAGDNRLMVAYYTETVASSAAFITITNITIPKTLAGGLHIVGNEKTLGITPLLTYSATSVIIPSYAQSVFVPKPTTNTLLRVAPVSYASGGVILDGFSATNAASFPLVLRGIHGAGTMANQPAVSIVGAAHSPSTTNLTTIGNTNIVFAIDNGLGTHIVTVTGNGNLSHIGTNFSKAVVATNSIQIGSGAVISGILSGSATLDFAAQTLGAFEDLPITVTGAADGDVVTVGVPTASATGIIGSFSGYASNATAYVRFVSTGTAQDPPSGTFKVIVTKF